MGYHESMQLSSFLNFLRKKLFTTRVLGVSLDGETLKSAHLVKEGKSIRIESCDTSGQLEKRGTLVSGLDSHAIIFRTLVVPLKGKRKVLAALPFQLESFLPFPPEQLIAAVSLSALPPHSTQVHVSATSKSALKKELDHLNAFGLFPDQMSSASAALMRLALWLFPKEPDCILLHRAGLKVHCVILKERRLVLSHCIADASLTELERLSLFIKEKIPGSDALPWVLLGSEDPSLYQQFFRGAQLLCAQKEMHTHTLAIGYALEGLFAREGTQFLQKEFSSQQSLKIKERNGIVYAVSCAALFLLFALSSTLILHKKSKALSDKYLSYFQTGEKACSSAAIEQALEKVELALNKTKNVSPFFPTLPSVSDLLSWLSTHPALTTPDGAAKEGIEIQDVHYQLTKFPTLDDPTLTYQATVEIRFTATTPRLARDFHEALLKTDPLVNGKKELKWNAAGNHYSAQFELNRKIL